jgi:hypothetical protein
MYYNVCNIALRKLVLFIYVSHTFRKFIIKCAIEENFSIWNTRKIKPYNLRFNGIEDKLRDIQESGILSTPEWNTLVKNRWWGLKVLFGDGVSPEKKWQETASLHVVSVIFFLLLIAPSPNKTNTVNLFLII